mgnify:CR=1 FL=1
MLDIKFLRSNPDVVKQNIKNKFQDEKLPLVDEVIELDKRNREIKQEVEALRAEKNKASKEIGAMMAQKKLEEAEALKKKVAESNGRINELSEEEKILVARARKVQRFLSQPFHVAEQFTGLPGKYVPVAETIRGFQEILEGKHDDIPENLFLNAGTIDEVVERMNSK